MSLSVWLALTARLGITDAGPRADIGTGNIHQKWVGSWLN